MGKNIDKDKLMGQKTNVVRVLDQAKIQYKQHCYADTDAVCGLDVASVLKQDPEQVFKTLVTVGKSGDHYVFVIPVNSELDLRKAAKAVNEKSVDMIKSKELLPLTGYIHGGCSPIGMKKRFVTVIDERAIKHNTIIFSAGKIGYQVELLLDDLHKLIPFLLAEITDGRSAVTAAQMKEIERRSAENGLSYYEMMENAGSAAAEFIMDKIPAINKKILIFCGKGNNGGDGFVAGRKLAEAGACCTLYLVDGEPKTRDAITNWQLCRERDIPIYDMTEPDTAWNNMNGHNQEITTLSKEADIIVDAIYGTGFAGDLRENARIAAVLINSRNKSTPVFALDMPSGLSSDTGEADRDTVRADYTLAFHRFKHAHLMEKCDEWVGLAACIDIGIPPLY